MVHKPVNGIFLVLTGKIQGLPLLQHSLLHGAMGHGCPQLSLLISDPQNIPICVGCLQIGCWKEMIQVAYGYFHAEYGLNVSIRSKQRSGVCNDLLILRVDLKGRAPVSQPLGLAYLPGRLIWFCHKRLVGICHIQAEAPVCRGCNLHFLRHIPWSYQHIKVGVLPAAPVRIIVSEVQGRQGMIRILPLLRDHKKCSRCFGAQHCIHDKGRHLLQDLVSLFGICLCLKKLADLFHVIIQIRPDILHLIFQIIAAAIDFFREKAVLIGLSLFQNTSLHHKGCQQNALEYSKTDKHHCQLKCD